MPDARRIEPTPTAPAAPSAPTLEARIAARVVWRRHVSLIRNNVHKEQATAFVYDIAHAIDAAVAAERAATVERCEVEIAALAEALNNILEVVPEEDPERHSDVRRIHVPLEADDWDCQGENCIECERITIAEIANRALLSVRGIAAIRRAQSGEGTT